MLGGFDRWTEFAASAFDRMLSRGDAPVDIRFGSHDAPRLASTANGTAGLFVDNFGLGFWARVDASGWRGRDVLRSMTRPDSPLNQCSGNFIIRKTRAGADYAQLPSAVVTEAEIDHIAIVDRGVYGTGTGAWPADWLDDAPWRIRDLAQKWADGAARWDAKIAAATRAARPANSPRSAAVMTAANRAAWAALQRSPHRFASLEGHALGLAPRVLGASR